MAYARPFYRSSRLQHLAAGLALGLSLLLIASSCGDQDTELGRDLALAGGVAGEIPIDLDVEVIPGDCDSTGAEAYRVPYGPNETPPDGVRDRIRVVIHTCCCCADSSYAYTPLPTIEHGGGVASTARPRVRTPLGVKPPVEDIPGEVASFQRRRPSMPEAPRDAIPHLPSVPFASLALPGASVTPPAIQPATRVPWWLGLLAIPAGFFVIEEMPEGTMCDDSGPAVGPNRASCDLPPRRASQT